MPALIATMASQSDPAAAEEADVINATAKRLPNGSYVVIATIRQNDEGWEHYADRYEVVAPDGTILATRKLAHPHIDEQPLTRALTGIKIPRGVIEITVRAHDKTHALGGKEFTIKLEE